MRRYRRGLFRFASVGGVIPVYCGIVRKMGTHGSRAFSYRSRSFANTKRRRCNRCFLYYSPEKIAEREKFEAENWAFVQRRERENKGFITYHWRLFRFWYPRNNRLDLVGNLQPKESICEARNGNRNDRLEAGTPNRSNYRRKSRRIAGVISCRIPCLPCPVCVLLFYICQ
jgi:hypothetical protein